MTHSSSLPFTIFNLLSNSRESSNASDRFEGIPRRCILRLLTTLEVGLAGSPPSWEERVDTSSLPPSRSPPSHHDSCGDCSIVKSSSPSLLSLRSLLTLLTLLSPSPSPSSLLTLPLVGVTSFSPPKGGSEGGGGGSDCFDGWSFDGSEGEGLGRMPCPALSENAETSFLPPTCPLPLSTSASCAWL